MMEADRPIQEFPQRAPLKIIGRGEEMDPQAMAAVILAHLGPQAEPAPTLRRNGAYSSYTFWVILPDEGAERPLREALHRLPGVVMQL